MRSILPIKEAVQAALHYVNPEGVTMKDWEFACDTMYKERTDQDRENVCSMLAAAARILADEVERMRAELNTNKTIILNTVLSDCCEAPAVVAGKPGSTQWHVCTKCCQTCVIFYQDKNTQPE